MLRIKRFGIICYVLMLGWMAFIFIMSAQTAKESSGISGGIVSKLIAVFFKDFDALTSLKQAEIINIITLIVRKTAHFLEYFILGVLSFLATSSYHKYKYNTKKIYAFLICVLYAASDEIHQYFVPGRACRFLDICIDSAGSITAILAVAILVLRKRRKSGEFNEKKEID